MSSNKIFILLPDGVGIRNYLYTKVFESNSEDLVLFHAFDSKTVETIMDFTNINKEVKIPIYKETIKEKFLRELITLLRLKSNTKLVNNPSLMTNWKSNHKGLSKKIFYKVIALASNFFKTYDSILKLELAYQKNIRKTPFYNDVKKIFEIEKPQQLFCTHQRGLQCAPIFAVANDLGIKTTTVIYSWDNLPKARLALRADSYLVWSDYMKSEMELYYPEVPQKNVVVTGTPQFEFYSDPENIIGKVTFYKKYNLDPNKKIICFSGDDIQTSPDDPSYLKDIAEALIKGNLTNEYQILLRRCPVDFSGRFDEVVLQNKEIIKEASPLWNYSISKHWSAVYPTMEDIKLLVSTALYSDIVINVGSTMAFDFAMFNKPCVFINYDQEIKVNINWSVKTIYEFQHFRSMVSSEAVIWLNYKSEIADIIQNAKNKNQIAIHEWKDCIIGDYQNASKSIEEKLKLN